MGEEIEEGRDRSAEAAKRLGQDEIDRIIMLKLARVSVRQIAADVGCNKDTVTTQWRRYLDDASTDRSQNLERHRQEAFARIDSIAEQSRHAATRARGVKTPDGSAWLIEPDHHLEVRALRTELRAMVDLARVAGMEAPKVLQLAPARQPTAEEATQMLEDLGLDTDALLADMGIEADLS